MRQTTWRLAIKSGATDVAAWLQRRRATILTYHGLIAETPPPALRPLNKLMVTVDAFRAQMQVLRSRYQVVPLEFLARRVARGDSVENMAAVTLDDGWRSTRTLAAPILRELGVPATVFLATGLMDSGTRGLWTQRVRSALHASGASRLAFAGIDLPSRTPLERAIAIRRIVDLLKRLPRGDRLFAIAEIEARYGRAPSLGEEMAFMTWSEARELACFGVDAGAHTVDHEILSCLALPEASRQVRASKADIERELCQPCLLFAYPNGSADDFTSDHETLMLNSGFLAAVTQIPGRNAPETDRFRLRRINVGLDHTPPSFLAELEGIRHWGYD